MDKQKWENGQALEFDYHKKCQFRANEKRWSEESLKLLTGLGIDPHLSGKTILDLGCGSKLRTKILVEKNTVIGTDPLANDYKTLPFSDLNLISVFNEKAETLIEELVGRFDICVCLNVLDHCVDQSTVIHRIAQYLKPQGVLYLWTDIGHTDNIHDGSTTSLDIEKMLLTCGFVIERMTVDIDPYDFVSQNTKNYKRCGASCQKNVSCVVVKAVKNS